MKPYIKAIALLSLPLLFASCEKDAGTLPAISFKTDSGYVAGNVNLPAGSQIKVGINAAKTEDKDVLKKFNISKSVNQGTPRSVFSKNLSSSEGNTFSYDYQTTLENTPGQNNTYIFTVTNRDGLSNKVELTVTID